MKYFNEILKPTHYNELYQCLNKLCNFRTIVYYTWAMELFLHLYLIGDKEIDLLMPEIKEQASCELAWWQLWVLHAVSCFFRLSLAGCLVL